jgi:hypothetical protein
MNGLNLKILKSESTQTLDMEEELTLEDVCPIWSEKLKKGIDDLDRHILATDSKYCLVGEAWGFTGKQTGYFIAPLIPVVGCWTCLKYGRKFGLIAKKQKGCTAPSLQPLISEFLVHWNQRHKAVTKSLKR